MYSSLFKKDDVRITQQFHSGHKALDLSRGVVRQPIYSGIKLGPGVVSYTATSYTSSGKTWTNSWVVYIKYDNGMTCRMFHGQVNDAVVKKGDRVVPGQQAYRTGSTGNSTADHLHYVLLDKNGVAIDPTPWVINDNTPDFKKGDSVVFTGIQNIRKGAGDKFEIARSAIIGEIATIKDGPRTSQNKQFNLGENDSYTWWDMIFEKGGTGWVADVGKFEHYLVPSIPPEGPVVPPEDTECEKRYKEAQSEISGLKIELGASQGREGSLSGRVSKLELDINMRDLKISELEVSLANIEDDYKRILGERNRFEKEKLELQRELDELKQGRDTWIKRLGDILAKLFGRE